MDVAPPLPEATFDATSLPILEYMKIQGIAMERVCLLDPKGSKELLPEDAGEFDWFLFGVMRPQSSLPGLRFLQGILGV